MPAPRSRLALGAAALLAIGLGAAPAQARDASSCGGLMVCASYPESVRAAVEKAGLKPKLTKAESGNPLVEADNRYHFDIYFYGCEEGAQCDSLRFEMVFEKAPENSAELANKWNRSKRFIQAAYEEDGELSFGYDISTMGGLRPETFADVLDWWFTMEGELVKFFDEHVPKKEKKDAEAVAPTVSG